MDLRVPRPDPPSRFGGKPFPVRLVDGQGAPLCLEWSSGGPGLFLRADGLNRPLVEAWLSRHGCSDLSAAGPVGSGGTAKAALVSTLVLGVDPRVGELAVLYAELVGAPFREAADPQDVTRTVRDLAEGQSLTLVLLGDCLDEALCEAISAANQARRSEGRAPARYGFLSALTPEQLAWLIVKTVILLARMPLSSATFADWDLADERGSLRTREAFSGRMTLGSVKAPWSDERVDAISVRAHGASFDLSLGDTVLCCHQDPPLPTPLVRRGPSCFHDGACFRMATGSSPPTTRIPAQQAMPLVWCLDSCATFALRGCAFGPVTYAAGLVAGAAVGVIGPFLDIVTSGDLARVYNGILATGGTLGEAAAAACAYEQVSGFDRFLLVGSPDLRLLPPAITEPLAEMDGDHCRLRGRGQQIWRIRSTRSADAPLGVLADDGSDLWATARCDEVPDEAGSSLLVTLDSPSDLDGWLRVGPAMGSLQTLGRRAERIAAGLAMLRLYPFVDAEDEELAHCEEWAAILSGIGKDRSRVRLRADAAIALARLHLALDALHGKIARQFMVGDVSLDRLPAIGFNLEPTERSADFCPSCEATLFVTRGRWSADSTLVRRWVQCPNCAGIALELEDSPLVVRALTADVADEKLELAARLWNRSGEAIQVTLAGQARAGPPESRWGPERVTLDAGEERTVRFGAAGLEAPGVISYRLLALCDGDAQLHAVRRPRDIPDGELVDAGPTLVAQP